MNLEKEFDTLALVLGKMKEQYVKFKEMLIKQRMAIIANDIQELSAILPQIELINENINRLDVRRTYNAEILIENASFEAKTIRDIVKAYPELDGEKLEKAALELKKEVQDVKTMSASNSELLEISRSIIKETMKTIMTQNTDPRDKAWRTYGNSGSYSRTVRREPVHLVNKRG